MAKAKVVVIKVKNLLSSPGNLNTKRLSLSFLRGFSLLTEQGNSRDALHLIFSSQDRIGIKINTIAGKKLSTRPEVSLSLAQFLMDNNFSEKNVIIWDRTNRELREAGYSLNFSRNGLKIYGTDSDGAGYTQELLSHRNIGSLLSTILTNFVTASISFALLKDHGLAGVTAGMKNYFGSVHNPNKYHDTHCDPFVAELFDTEIIKRKHKLTILDCLLVQYHRGPSFHPQWAEKYEAFVFSLDPVAADFIGWKIIDRLRAQKGLPSLEEEGRAPRYLLTAEKMGLGSASLKDIQIIEEEI